MSDERDFEAMNAILHVYNSLASTPNGRSLFALQLLPGPLFGWGMTKKQVSPPPPPHPP